jgi:hypothetical protein
MRARIETLLYAREPAAPERRAMKQAALVEELEAVRRKGRALDQAA